MVTATYHSTGCAALHHVPVPHAIPNLPARGVSTDITYLLRGAIAPPAAASLFIPSWKIEHLFHKLPVAAHLRQSSPTTERLIDTFLPLGIGIEPRLAIVPAIGPVAVAQLLQAPCHHCQDIIEGVLADVFLA